jgi:hypothetical protein
MHTESSSRRDLGVLASGTWDLDLLAAAAAPARRRTPFHC